MPIGHASRSDPCPRRRQRRGRRSARKRAGMLRHYRHHNASRRHSGGLRRANAGRGQGSSSSSASAQAATIRPWLVLPDLAEFIGASWRHRRDMADHGRVDLGGRLRRSKMPRLLGHRRERASSTASHTSRPTSSAAGAARPRSATTGALACRADGLVRVGHDGFLSPH